MAEKLSDKLKESRFLAGEVLKGAVSIAIVVFTLYDIASHNGKFDSMRTKEAIEHHNPNNTIKTVANVEEKWKDDIMYSLTLDGYNPQVSRKVTFKDGSQTKLTYRTLAWQPFMSWKNGNEFDPKQGERYEVTPHNSIVAKR